MARDVIVHVFRHGKATGSVSTAELTPEGEEQARKAAQELLNHIPEGAVVKFFDSGFVRARQTRERMEEIVKPQRRTLVARSRATLAYLKKVKDGFSDQQKTPQEGVADFRRTLVQYPKRLSETLAPGSPIHLVAVAHAGKPALNALVESLSGKTLEQLKGDIQNCERFTLHFKPGHAPMMHFREHHGPIRE